MIVGPDLEYSNRLHAEKYRASGESFREYGNRVAAALQDNDTHYHEFRSLLHTQSFLPAGRIQAAAGSTRFVTPYNCFVSGEIADDYVNGWSSIMGRAHQAAKTMRMGGGIGYDFSTLRPKDSLIKSQGSKASGPVSFMEIYDVVCRVTSSAGNRRGAQMAVMRVDHPDIEEFIHAKRNETSLTGFNISVGVTDEFMEAVVDDTPFALKWGGQIFRHVDARDLWENLMRSTYDWAEPGVLFLDTINRDNNLWYCEEICATNPCGEQPLPPFGACLLGSWCLPKYVRRSSGTKYTFDWDQFEYDIPHAVRALNNVIDQAKYPLDEQREEALNKRRMGIGVTGLANTVEALLGRPSYGDDDFLELTERILTALCETTYQASIDIAKERGSFPALDRDKYLESGFAKRALSGRIKEQIHEHGIANSHLLSIAPTGTISMAADNVSSGVEPVFAYMSKRNILMNEGLVVEKIPDFGDRVFGVRGRVAAEVTVGQHLSVLEVAQRWVDSSVSKTCNVPRDTLWGDFKEIYKRAWRMGAKGCTTFRDGGSREGMMVVAEDDSQNGEVVESCRVDPDTGKKECE